MGGEELISTIKADYVSYICMIQIYWVLWRRLIKVHVYIVYKIISKICTNTQRKISTFRFIRVINKTIKSFLSLLLK